MIDNFDGKYAFLSNFYKSEIMLGGIRYPSVEHAFQAYKSLELQDRVRIASAENPGIAKRLGRHVKLRGDWEQVKDDVMYRCLVKKFENPKLRQKLLATGNEQLVEGNTWHDNCWGDCHCPKCECKQGENRLGKLLMRVRDEIRNENVQRVLVVVDMQNDFVTGVLGTAEAQKIVPNVVNKIEYCLDAGHTVLFTMDTHGENYMQTQEGSRLPVEHCIEGTDGWMLIPEIRQWAFCCDLDNGGNVFKKPTFGSMELALYLQKMQDECEDIGVALEVEFIGVCTDICVVSNAMLTKTFAPNAIVKVDASCCAGCTPEKHNDALSVMQSCQIEVDE